MKLCGRSIWAENAFAGIGRFDCRYILCASGDVATLETLNMHELLPLAERRGECLKERKETIVIAESSSGGLLSAVLLALPGASAYYLGGAVVYTAKARVLLMDIPREAVRGMRSASEPYALLLARTA